MAEAPPKFNLDDLLRVAPDYNKLKEVLEYLLKRDQVQAGQIQRLESELDKTRKELGGIKAAPAHPPPAVEKKPSLDLGPIKASLAKIEDRVYSHDSKLAEHLTLIDTTSFNLRMTQMSVTDLESRVGELESLKKSMEELKERVDKLEKLIASLQSQLKAGIPAGSTTGESKGVDIEELKNMFGSKEQADMAILKFNDIENRLRALEQNYNLSLIMIKEVTAKTNINTEEIEALKEKLKALESKLAGKVDCEEFDKLVLLVKNSGSPAAAAIPSGVSIGSKELNQLKELLNSKIPEMEKRIEELFKLMKNLNISALEQEIKEIKILLSQKASQADLDSLKAVFEALSKEIQAMKTDIQALISRADETDTEIGKIKTHLDLLEAKFNNLNKTLTDMSAKLEQLSKKITSHAMNTGEASQNGFRVDETEYGELKSGVEGLKRDFADIQKEFLLLREIQKKLHQLEGLLDGKVDKEEFEKFKQETMQLISGIAKKFADKNEVMKWLKKLEKKLLMMEEMLASQSTNSPDAGDGAMLAKKPLGGWSCASCQKDLIALERNRAPYYPWAKLPVRDPAERIAKVGHGFSRMLSMLKPDLIARSQQIAAAQKRVYEEEGAIMSGEEDDHVKAMAKTHGADFLSSDNKRPSTANMLPNIQGKK